MTDKKLHNKIYQFVVSDLGLITRNAASNYKKQDKQKGTKLKAKLRK